MTVAVASTIAEARRAISLARVTGQTIGFVPTMGALHEGHATLIRAARKATEYVVVSIFVNPTQFGPQEDFTRYPRTWNSDLALAQRAGAALIFAPTAEEWYPPGNTTYVEVPGPDRVLCGPKRPGHFRGVCTVVAGLLNVVQPHISFFGRKDAQQAFILKQMVRDLHFSLEIRIEPTVREADGLALSSRNRYLSPEQRLLAPKIYQALQATQKRVQAGETDTAKLEAALNAELAAIPTAQVDYATIVAEDGLKPISQIDQPAMAAVAVFLGSTRLIDNIALS